jgi:prepilin-type N-terminal cleavage/methylation domain-containing protein
LRARLRTCDVPRAGGGVPARGLREVMPMSEQRRKPTLIEILIVMAILGILLSIMSGARQKARQVRTTPPAASQIERPSEDTGYFWRP